MAYSSTNPPLMLHASFPGGPRTYFYGSTHVVADIIATGFFAGCGLGSRTTSPSNVGMRVGDILINRSSTDAAVQGRTTLHSVISATADQSSTSASTGWNAAYNVTVSST